MSIQPGTWRFEWSANVNRELGSAVDMNRVGSVFSTEVAAKTGNRASLPNVQGNPFPQKTVIQLPILTDRYRLKLAFTLVNTDVINWRDLDAAFWESIKNSGAPGISVNRCVQAMPEGPGSASVDPLLSWNPTISDVGRTVQATTVSAPVAPPPASGAAVLSGETITQSRDASQVGQSQGGLGSLGTALGNAASGARDALSANSLPITIALVSVGVLAAAVAVGYTVRSFK